MSPARGTATPPGPAGQRAASQLWAPGVSGRAGREGWNPRTSPSRSQDPLKPPQPSQESHQALGNVPVSVLPAPARAPPASPRRPEGPPGLLNPPQGTGDSSERGQAPLTSPGPERPREPPSPHRRDTPEVPQGRRHWSVPKHSPPVIRPGNAAGTLVPEGNAPHPIPTPVPGIPRVPQWRQEMLEMSWMCSQTLCWAGVLGSWG